MQAEEPVEVESGAVAPAAGLGDGDGRPGRVVARSPNGTTMLRPSAAPRWKIATSTLRRVPPAAAVARHQAGANPRLRNARPPLRSRTRREIIGYLRWNSGEPSASAAIVATSVPLASVLRVPGDAAPPSRSRAAHWRATGGVGRAGERREIDVDALQAVRRQIDGEVHAIDERAGVDPRVGRVGVAGRRLREVQRHAERPRACATSRRGVGDVGAGRAQRADDELERRLHLGAARLGGEELGRGEDRARPPRADRRWCA